MEFLQNIYFTNLNVVSHLGGFFSIKKDVDWSLEPPSAFNQNKFYYITKGRCVINIDGKEYSGKPGSWFFIPANTVHSYHNIKSEPFQKFWIHFDLYPGKTHISDLLNLPYCIEVGDSKKVTELFSAFTASYKSSSIIDKIRIKSCLFDLLAEYIIKSQPQEIRVADKSDICMNSLLSYINENLEKNITNDDLARIAHMHPNHMIRFFKSKTNQTPAKYVSMQKIEYAKRLLENSELNITEIMQKIGIDDISHFSKLFKKFSGASPAKYRKDFKLSQTKNIKLAEKGTENTF